MPDLLGLGTDRGYSMIGVGLSATLSGGRKARVNLDPMPALDLNFAANRSLPADYGPTPSFSRASTGTFFNSSGVLTSAAVNVPRFDHVYSGGSWVSRGLLVEDQRTNYVAQSNNFGTYFSVGSAQIQSAAGTAPDGTTAAFKIYESAAAGGSLGQRRYANTPNIPGPVSFSIYAKAGERKRVLLFVNGPDQGAWFDLVSETCGSDSVYASASQKITSVGNGWYRCSMTTSGTTTGYTPQIWILLDGETTLANRVGDGSSGLYIAFAQAESGAFSTSYIPTSGSSATRSADVCQITGTSFSSFWNASEGSCIVEYDRLAPIGPATPGYVYPRTFCFYGGAGNSIDLFGNHGSSPASELLASYSASSVQFGFSANTSNNTANGTQVIGFATKLNDSAFSYNGDAVLADTSCVVPSINSLYIGSLAPSGNILNGHISRLRYYPTRLSNATLQSLST